ncbi:MAG: hypothetical protein LAP13_20145 [Acidobacteriia bacterium]|nr:hypothetical protein [Terriglobia bacterium]
MASADDAELEQQVAQLLRDFRTRTLEELSGDFERLIYVASLRDYNTGRYHHYGLETRYSEEAVDQGLRQSHAQVFERLLATPLKEQTEDLLSFFESLKVERTRLVDAWQRLRSYQVLPPEGSHPLARELFERNIEIMLQVLRETDLWPLLHDPHRDSNDLP